LTNLLGTADNISDTEIWEFNPLFCLVIGTVLTEPFLVDLVPERAVVETTPIFADLNPADVILIMFLTTFLVETFNFTFLLSINNSLSAVELFPVVQGPGNILLASSSVCARINLIGQGANLTKLASVVFVLRLAWWVHKLTKPVIFYQLVPGTIARLIPS